MLETKFGPMAQDGDFVLVVDFNYMKRKCETYMARVYRGKAYTGVRISGTHNYVHKMKAECVIPESYVPQEVRRKSFIERKGKTDKRKNIIISG